MISTLPHRQQLGRHFILLPSPQRALWKEPVGCRILLGSCTGSSFRFPDLSSQLPLTSLPLKPCGPLCVGGGEAGATSLLSSLHKALTSRPRNGLISSPMPPKSEPSVSQVNVATLGPSPHSLEAGMDGESGVTMTLGLFWLGYSPGAG